MPKAGRDYAVEGETTVSRRVETAKLRKKAIADFNRMIRIEAANDDGICMCVTCGKHFRWDAGIKEAHTGHFVAGSTNSVVFDERNAHPQCSHCNYYLSGNQEVYTQFMVDTYGQDVVDELRAARHKAKKLYRCDYVAMRKEYKARIKKQQERLGA